MHGARWRSADVLHLLDDIQLAQRFERALSLCKRHAACVLLVHVLDVAQPVVGEPTRWRRSAATRRCSHMPDHEDVFHLEDVDRETA